MATDKPKQSERDRVLLRMLKTAPKQHKADDSPA
jgi:hypothetical protein